MSRALLLLILSHFLFLFSVVFAQSSASSNSTGTPTSSGSIPHVTGINASLPLCAVLSCRQILTESNAECPNATAKCLCSSSEFQADAAHCIKTSCTTPTDQQNAYEYAVQVCAQAGVTLPPFDKIGESSGGSSVRLGYLGLFTAVVGMVLLVEGLV